MRLDKFLVERGDYPSRTHAQAAIKSGRVTLNAQTIGKASHIVAEGDEVQTASLHSFVSRGGIKLAHALEHWDISAAGKICLALGASTGGFTDVLLRHGADRVYAIDVGHSQLHPSLLQDRRVINHEKTDARNLTQQVLDATPELIVCDISFVALSKVLLPALNLVKVKAELIGLFKPQFELTPADIGKNGLVKDHADIKTSKLNFEAFLEAARWIRPKWLESPIKGGSGNIEFLFYSQKLSSEEFSESSHH